jgi:hypothetical protein
VVLITDGVEMIDEVLGHLRAQTVADRIELVVVAVPGTVPADSPSIEGFGWVQVVDSESRSSPPVARASGLRAAQAPVVVFGETHCFPQPEWAESLLEAHRGPWVAVGPEIGNENPDTTTSWALLCVDYSPWLAPQTSRPVEDLPGHNSSYKRAALLELGADLDRMFESESILHGELKDRGYRLYVESRASVRHRNITQVRHGLIEHFHNGRCFGGLRSRSWSPWLRALYAAGSPLIPLIRLRRLLKDVRGRTPDGVLARALPVIVLMLAVHASGEMWGYISGSGKAVAGMAGYELDRDMYAEA